MKMFALFATMIVTTALLAQPSPQAELKKIPAPHTKASSGAEMFKSYCAACHGTDGTCQGPAASALKRVPTDLTLLKQANGGQFPAPKVIHVLEGAGDITAHGTIDMPLWGPIFRALDANDASIAQLRIHNLTKYIESIQK